MTAPPPPSAPHPSPRPPRGRNRHLHLGTGRAHRSVTRLDRPARIAAAAGLLAGPALGYATAHYGLGALAAVLLGLTFAAVVRWPTLGVYALVAGTFFDELHIPTGFALLGAADLAALLLLPAWILRRLLEPGDLRLPRAWPLVVIYLALAFASLVLGVAPRGAYGNYARLVTYAAALAALVDLVRAPATLRHITTIMALCGLTHALVSLTDPAPARRLLGLADQPNILGVRLALGALPAAALWAHARRPLARWGWGLALLAMLIAIALTISRGTYLALGLGFVWWMRRSPRLALAIGLAAVTSYVVLDRVATDRVTAIERRMTLDDQSVTQRGVVAQNALTVITERPLLGVGFGQFRALDEVVGVLDQAGRGSHNFYLGVAASTGLPALACLIGFALIQVRRMRPPIPSPDDAPPAPGIALPDLVTLWQAIAVYHGASLAVRGGLRLTDWTLLGLYAALACIARRAR